MFRRRTARRRRATPRRGPAPIRLVGEVLEPRRLLFKPYSHVFAATEAWNDAVDDGQVTIAAGATTHNYAVPAAVKSAIQNYKPFYNAGVVGPDAFPDLVYGQGIVHPESTGLWLRHAFEAAWRAQSDPSYSAAEKGQILAWTYGFLTHAAGDVWAHTMVNEFAQGVFPAYGEILTDQEKASIAVRHLLVEMYIEDATPGFDANPDRTTFTYGGVTDTSDNSTPPLPLDAPHRFIYETFVKPDAGQPRVGLDAAGNPLETQGLVLDFIHSTRDKLNALVDAAQPKVLQLAGDIDTALSVFNNFDAGAAAAAFGDIFLCSTRDDLIEAVKVAYIRSWVEDIDRGLEHWSELGLAIARGLFDPQARRNLQNELGSAVSASESDPDRIAAENGVGVVDTILHEVGIDEVGTRNKFFNKYLLPMLGVPDGAVSVITKVRQILANIGDAFSEVIERVSKGVEKILNPILEPIQNLEQKLKDYATDLIVDAIENWSGIDITKLEEFLKSPSSKMDLTSIDLGGSIGTITLFQSGDHALLDGYLGITGNHHAPANEPPLSGGLLDNVTFDADAFAAYKNAVTLSKLVLLDGATLDQMLSDLSGQPYSLYGPAGGNIMLTPLPGITIPDVTGIAATSAEIQKLQRLRDTALRQWMFSIDAGLQWREPQYFVDVGSGQIKSAAGGLGNFPLAQDAQLRTSVFDALFDPPSNTPFFDAGDPAHATPDDPLDNAGVKTGLKNGLAAVVTWSQNLSALTQFGQELPLVGLSLDEQLDVPGLLQQRLYEPLAAYLDGDATPTSAEMVAAMKNLATTVGSLSMRVDPVMVGGGRYSIQTAAGVREEARYEMRFRASRTENVPIDLGQNARDQHLAVIEDEEPTVPLDVALDFDIAFGYNLAPGLAAQDAFYLEIRNLTASADVHVRDLAAPLRVGMFDLEIAKGQIDLDAAVRIVPTGSFAATGRYTQGQLGQSIGTLVTAVVPGAEHKLAFTFPIVAGFAGFDGCLVAAGAITVTGTAADTFDGSPPAVTLHHFEELESFANLNAFHVVSFFQGLGSWLGDFGGSSSLGFSFPFLNLSLGNLFKFDLAFLDKLFGPLNISVGTPSFGSIQGLFGKLFDLFGIDASASFDAPDKDVTYHVKYTKDFDPLTNEPLSFSQNLLGSLVNISTSSTVNLAASVTMEFDIGLNFKARVSQIVGSLDAPANGRLGATAHFMLAIDTAAAIGVSVPADAGNNSIDDLVADINAALPVGLVGKVQAERRGNRVALVGIGQNKESALTLASPAGDPWITALGFASSQSEQDSLFDHLFIQNATLSGEGDFTAADIDAAARFGGLGVAVVDGSGSAHAAISIPLTDPGTHLADGRITLGELFDSLLTTGGLDALVGTPEITGNVQLALPVRTTPSFFGPDEPADPRITFAWNDITVLDTQDPDGPQLAFNQDMNKLLAFEHFDWGVLIDALRGVVQYLRDSGDVSFLSEKLPVVNKRIDELLDYASRLETFIDQLETQPDAAVQTIETELEELLGLVPDDPRVELAVDGSALRLDLTFVAAYDSGPVSLDLDLDELAATLPPGHPAHALLAGVTNLIDVRGTAQLAVSGDAALNLDVGIDLSTPTAPRPFLYDTTSLVLHGRATASDMDFAALVGPFGIFVKDGTARLDDRNQATGNPASFTVSLDADPVDHRYYFDQITTEIVNVDLDGAIDVRLPLYFPLQSIPLGGSTADANSDGVPDNELRLAIGDLRDIPGTISLVVPDFTQAFNFVDLFDSLTGLLVGLDSLLGELETAIDSQALGHRLPLVGDKLDEAVTLVRDVRERIDAVLEYHLATGGNTLETVRHALFDALGPGGLNLLQDRPTDGDALVTMDDIVVTLADLDNDGQQDDQADFAFHLAAQGIVLNYPFQFDIGFDSLGLEVAGGVEVALGFDWHVAFGVRSSAATSVDAGFYFNTAGANEISLSLAATIPNLAARGELGFLQLDVNDDPLDPTHLGVGVTIDLVDPSGSGRLTVDEIFHSPVDSFLSAELFGEAEVNLDLLVSFDGDARFPSIAADLFVYWPFDTGTFEGSTPIVAFNNVRLNVGEFIDDLLEPIVKKVGDYARSIKPFTDFLTTPLPILDLFLPPDAITPLRLAQVFGYVGPETVKFIESLDAIIDAVATIPDVPDGVYVPLGSFDLGYAPDGPLRNHQRIDPRDLEDLTGIVPNITQVVDPLNALLALPHGPQTRNYITDTRDEAYLKFPILEEPIKAFRLLLGQNVDFFLADLPDVNLGFSPRIQIGPLIPPIPIFAEIAGSVRAHLDLKLGYDAHGLFKYRETGDVYDIFAGFFLSDRENADGTGKDVPEATLVGEITVGLVLDLSPIARAGVEGGIGFPVYINLHDPNGDGKVHLDEFLENIEKDFLCTFDVSGEVDAFLRAFIEAPLFGYNEDQTLVNVQLLDFELTDEDCFPDRFSGNNSQATATDIGIGPGQHVDGLALETTGDEDWYRFELLRPDSIDVDVRYSQVIGDVNLAVFDSAGQQIGVAKSTKDRDVVSLHNVPAGTYYVRVFGHDDPQQRKQNEYKLAIEPRKSSSTRVIYVAPEGNEDHDHGYYAFDRGENRHSGLSYRKPKPSLQSVLDAFDLGPNDLVVIDTGTYPAGGLIQAADGGATFTGTPEGSYVSGVVLQSTDNTRFERVGWGGAGPVGLRIEGSSQNNRIRRGPIQNIGTGIRVDGLLPNLIEQNFSQGAGGTGIFLVSGATTTVRSNDVAGRSVGIDTASKVAPLYGNAVHGNTVGIVATGAVIGPDNPPPFGSPGGKPPNDVFGNATGILIPGGATGALVRHNVVRANDVGIEALSDDSLIVANDVYGNEIGIRGDDIVGPPNWDTDEYNVIHANATGAWVNPGGELRFNRIFGNGLGVHAAGGYVHHNLIYDNTDDGILANSLGDVLIRHNTVYAPSGNAVRLENVTGLVTLRNNVLEAHTGAALYVAANSQFRYASDYNNLFAPGGKVAFQGKFFYDLFDWQVEAEQDLHSLGSTAPDPTRDAPQFAGAAAGDFHLLAGSTSIDAADPASAFAFEPGSGGGRADLGAYGNTPQGGTSPASWLTIPGPQDYYQDLEPNLAHTIAWESFNVGGNLDIDLLQEGVGKIADIVTVAAAAGSTSWVPQNFGVASSTTNRYRIRLASLANPALVRTTREPFAVVSPGTAFYVDDGSSAGDEYTPAAVGNNRGTGTTPSDPKVVVRPLVISYALGPGATVYVDTGSYVHAVNLNLSGAPIAFDPRMNAVTGAAIVGPTDPAHVASIDRANPFVGATAVHFIDADDMTLARFTIVGAEIGVTATAGSTNLAAAQLKLTGHTLDGLAISGASNGARLDALQAFTNGRDGIYVDSLLVHLFDSEAFDNGRNGGTLHAIGAALVEGSKFHDNGATGLEVFNPGGATATIGQATLELGRGNLFYANGRDGALASGWVTVVGNTSSDNARYGIRLDDGADALRNVVRQNQTGISALGSTSDIIENRSFAHSDTGIEASFDSQLLRNVVYSNANYGIHVERFSGWINHNLVYSTGIASMLVEGPGTAPVIDDNTVYEPCADNASDPPATPIIEVPWDWTAQLDYQGQTYLVPLWGTVAVQFGNPVGLGAGGTFDLGRGGGAGATTPGPVPPGQAWRIDAQIVALNLSSQMFDPIPGLGHVEVRLKTDRPLPPAPPTGTGTGLVGAYFDNGGDTSLGGGTGPLANLTGKVFTRVDSTVDFNWGAGSPDPRIGPETFSVVWLGQIEPQFSETYTFYSSTDDGGFLVIGAQVVIDDRNYHAQQEFPAFTASGSKALVAGQKYDVAYMAFEYGGNAGARLAWSSPSTPLQIIPQSQLYPNLPATPLVPATNLTANPNTEYAIDLNWTDTNPQAIGYIVARSTNGDPQSFYEVARVSGHSFQDSVLPGSTYFYRITPFTVGAEGPPSNVAGPAHTSPRSIFSQGVVGYYYNNPERRGAPALVRTEFGINQNWGSGSPGPGVNSDLFSSRYTGTLLPPVPGQYTFISRTDDGAFLWLNGELIIDDPNYHGVMDVFSAPVNLQAGQPYSLVFEQFDAFFDAAATLEWLRPDGAGGFLREVVPFFYLRTWMDSPAAPSGLVVNGVTARTATIAWNDVSTSEFQYFVERAVGSPLGPWQEVAALPPNSTSYTDAGLLPGQMYFYRVRGGNFDFFGSYSIALPVQTLPFETPPAAPPDLSAVARPGQIRLHWTDLATNETQYVVERNTGPGGSFVVVAMLAANATSYVDGDAALLTGTTYGYRVRASNAAGPSGNSPVALATAGGAGGVGLGGSYYDNADFTHLALERMDPVIDFNWGLAAPQPAIQADTFSVAWQGQVQAEYSELYTFNVETDDGVRVYVDNQLLIDAFFDQPPTVHTGSLALVAGQRYDLRVEYYENTVGAVARLRWSSPSLPLETIPRSLLFPPAAVPSRSLGSIVVENQGGFLVGSSTFALSVEFVLPNLGVTVSTAAPLTVANTFGPGQFNPLQVLQTPFQTASPLGVATGLVDDRHQAWGDWEGVECVVSPGHDEPGPQSPGPFCAEVGIIIRNDLRNVLLRNNEVYVEGHQDVPPEQNSLDILVEPDSTLRWDSDFNVLLRDFGNIGRFGGVLATSLPEWQAATNDDWHSISPDPRFIWVDQDGLDGILGFGTVGAGDGRDDNFHLRSPFGHAISGALAPAENVGTASFPALPLWLPLIFDPMPAVAIESPSIDWGEPSYSFALEPDVPPWENGQLIDVGTYGNTVQASSSEPFYVDLVFPLGYERLVPGRTYRIEWRSYDYLGTVAIELRRGSANGPLAATIAAAAPNSGSYLWTVPTGLAPSSDYTVVVSRALAVGECRFNFAIGSDDVPPFVRTSTPLVVDHELPTNAAISSITVFLNEALLSSAALAAGNYELRSAGPNRAFDDGDDVIFAIVPSYSPPVPNGAPASVALAIAGGPLPAGEYRLKLRGTGLVDTAGLPLDGDGDGVGGDDYVRLFTVDFTPPTVDVLDVSPDPRSSSLAAITIVFSEPVRGFGLADVRLTRNGGGNLLTGLETLATADDVTWTLSGLAARTDLDGLYVLELMAPQSNIVDLAGNALAAGALDSWYQDTVAPSADVVDVVPDPRAVGVAQITIVFSEPVVGFTLADLVLARDGGANLLSGAQTLSSSDNMTFVLENLAGITALAGEYALVLAAGPGVTDPAGNALALDAFEGFTVDYTPPAADVLDVSGDPRNSPVDQITIAFDEPVFGFDLADLVLSRSGGGNLLTGAQTLTTNDRQTWILGNLPALTAADGGYTLSLAAVGTGIVDAAGNALATGAAESWWVESVRPTVQIVPVAPDPRNSAVGQLTIVFSEPVVGFDLADLALTLGGGPNLLSASQTLSSADGVTWLLGNLAGLTAIEGAYSLTIAPAATIVDVAGNALLGGASESFVIDRTPPTIDIVDVVPDPGTSPIDQIQLVASEPLVGLSLADLRLTRGGGANMLSAGQTLVSADGIHWTLGNLAGLTGQSGTYVLSIPAYGAGITDLVGNALAITPIESFALAIPLVVVNTLDGGPGSLRQALLDANAQPGADTIVFAIAGAGPHVIAPLSALPSLTESVTLDLPAGQDVSVGSAGFGWPAFTSLAKIGGGTLTVGGGAGGAVAGGALAVDGGTLRLAAGGTTVLVLDALAVAGGAALDLADNDAIVHATAATRGAVLAYLTGQLASGAAGLAWNGSGIHSSAAAADPSFLTAVGIMVNDNGLGGAYRATFAGQAVDANSVLLKYTYYGDADLSGTVDGTDYALIDNGFNSGLADWFNGDFNFSAAVDGTDYALIDNAFNSQGGPLAGAPAAGSPIPRAAWADWDRGAPAPGCESAAATAALDFPPLAEADLDALLGATARRRRRR